MSAATPGAVSKDSCGELAGGLARRVASNWWEKRRTGGKADVVERQLGDARVQLKEQRERLADTTGGTEDGDLGGLQYIMSAYGVSMAATFAAIQQQKAGEQAASELRGGRAWDCWDRERAYLAGRHREGAALGLGESVPGSEHDGCDGGINEDGLT
jgi:hypothetical protein